MTVIPFRRSIEPQPLAFAIGARVDLRVGALASGVVRPRGPAREAFAYSHLARVLRAARLAWRERAPHAMSTLAAPSEYQHALDPDLLSEAATEAGYTRRALTFELCERALVANGALAEDLRARGWSVTLRADPDCPLPFGARARALYTEIVLAAPSEGPHVVVDVAEQTPLGRRLMAARAAGIIVTAEGVRSAAQARALAIAGYDRGGGPYAESTQR